MTSVESDYAIPPDAYGSLSSSSSLLALSQVGGNPLTQDEPEFKLLKTSSGETPACHRSVATPSVKSGEAKRSLSAKCGYLKKLSGKSRQWKKRWFVLQRGRMSFYKTSVSLNFFFQLYCLKVDSKVQFTKVEYCKRKSEERKNLLNYHSNLSRLKTSQKQTA